MTEQLQKKLNENVNEKAGHLDRIEELENNLKETESKVNELN